MHVGDLGPGKGAIELVEPGESGLGPLDRLPASPCRLVAWLIQHMHRDSAVAAALVAVLRIERQREVVHVFGIPAELLAALGSPATLRRRRAAAVKVALIVDAMCSRAIGLLPARIAADGNSGCSHHLVCRHVEVHQEGCELAVELTRWIEGMLLPAV